MIEKTEEQLEPTNEYSDNMNRLVDEVCKMFDALFSNKSSRVSVIENKKLPEELMNKINKAVQDYVLSADTIFNYTFYGSITCFRLFPGLSAAKDEINQKISGENYVTPDTCDFVANPKKCLDDFKILSSKARQFLDSYNNPLLTSKDYNQVELANLKSVCKFILNIQKILDIIDSILGKNGFGDFDGLVERYNNASKDLLNLIRNTKFEINNSVRIEEVLSRIFNFKGEKARLMDILGKKQLDNYLNETKIKEKEVRKIFDSYGPKVAGKVVYFDNDKSDEKIEQISNDLNKLLNYEGSESICNAILQLSFEFEEEKIKLDKNSDKQAFIDGFRAKIDEICRKINKELCYALEDVNDILREKFNSGDKKIVDDMKDMIQSCEKYFKNNDMFSIDSLLTACGKINSVYAQVDKLKSQSTFCDGVKEVVIFGK